MAESTNKVFLDLAGLKHYDEKLKAKMATDDATVLSSAKSYTDEKIGSLDDGITTVAAGILAEKNRAIGVEGALTDLTTEAKGTLVAAINEVDAHADSNTSAIGTDTTEGTVKYRIKQLETAVGEGGSVGTQIDTKINALDVAEADATSTKVAGVQVKVSEVDGKVQAPTVTVDDNALIVTYTAGSAPSIAPASTTAVLKGDAVAKIAEYVGDVVAELDSSTTATKTAGIQISVTETNGKLSASTVSVDDNTVTYTAKSDDTAANLSIADSTAVLKGDAISVIKTYVDAMDAASSAADDARLDALEATHATKKDGSFKTVAAEVNEAVTSLIDGAPDALNTLNEIAQWIADTDSDNKVTSTKLITTVDKLDGDDTTEGSVKSLIKTTKEALDATNNVSDATAGVTVKVDEVDGIVSKPVVTVSDNAVTYSAAVPATEDAAAQAAKLEVSQTGNVLKGQAIAEIKKYIDAMDAANAADSTAAINALDVSNNISDAVAGVSVTVNETDGKVSKPVVAVADNVVTTLYTSGSVPSISVASTTGVLKGSAISSIKAYVDDSIKELDATVSQPASATQALSLSITEADGKITYISGDIATITTDDIDALFTTTTKE